MLHREDTMKNHPGFHVWIFNHLYFYGIGDQVHFLFKYFQQNGYQISCGRQPREDRCNIIIENFDFRAVEHVRKFCNNYGKSVSIVLTEHVDIIGKVPLPIGNSQVLFANSVYLHGKPVESDFSYLPLDVLLQRVNNLLSLRECTHSYMRLGDLPRMHGFEHLVFNRSVKTLWFPKLDDNVIRVQYEPVYDFAFIGAVTPYREAVLDRLRLLGFTFAPVNTNVSVKMRQKQYQQVKYCLNIPQDKEWPWLSPMRIISALQAGVATISIGTNDPSAISSCTIRICEDDIMDNAITLKSILNDHQRQSQNMFCNYELLSSSFDDKNANHFLNWALTDGLFKDL